ncbi:MAG: hypothetical protein QOF74_3699 [Caballeronia mineralivorans]|jgi:hypothetical protein|nr:hypothetical protein [Caballeronia mineralivorans]
MISTRLFLGIYNSYPKFLRRLADKTTASPKSHSFSLVFSSIRESPRYRLCENVIGLTSPTVSTASSMFAYATAPDGDAIQDCLCESRKPLM